jgi:CheY-like chemotaxis protein
MGFEFLELDSAGRGRLTRYLEQLTAEVAPPPQEPFSQTFAVVADGSQSLLDRLENALTSIGFETLLFRTGSEALAACNELIPDVVVAAFDMPGMDGLTLLTRLAAKPRLAEVPVVLMSDEAADFTRLQAYRLGVRDVIPKPFSDEELRIRVRRAALEGRRPPAEPVLRGNLSEISIATLLSLFEFERKSGILLLLRDGEIGRLFVSEGKVLKVESSASNGTNRIPKQRLMQLLDWQVGQFEFSPCAIGGRDELDTSITAVLLEHARMRDEQSPDKTSKVRR